jgi:hypothetical protein
MTQTLTEERRIAWRQQGTGPAPAHSLVIFRKVGQGRVLHATLHPGQVFKRPWFTAANSFEAYAVSADENLRHEFSRRYQSGVQTWTFTLQFKLDFRVGNVERFGLSLSGRDPLERLEEEVASLLSATARRFSWEVMKQEGEDFGLRLREAEVADGQGECRSNFRRLQDFAASLGLDLRHLDVLRFLTEPDVTPGVIVRSNERRKEVVRSEKEVAAVQERLDHELQAQRDQHRIERETAIARSSQALQGMERLRSILDAIVQGGSQAIVRSAGDLRSFSGIHQALIEIQGIQASLAGLSGGTAAPALAAGAPEGPVAGAVAGGVVQLAARRDSPLESMVAEAFRQLRSLDGNPRDQRRILASVLHLAAEAGLGSEADEEFLTGLRNDLEGRLQPVQSALPQESLAFLGSILDLEDLRQRLA